MTLLKLYIASYNKGLLIYDLQQQAVVRSFQQNSESLPIPSNRIRKVHIDRKGNIYMEHYGKYGKCVTFCYCINAGNQNA